jgi:hypothetical protein
VAASQGPFRPGSKRSIVGFLGFWQGETRTDRVANWSEETSDGLLGSIGSYLGTRAYG